MIDLGLKQKEVLFKNTEKELLSAFYSSSTGKSNKEFRFAKVDSNFINFLPYLNDGAIKLYLYYVVVAKNDTGESWHSIDTISQKLNATGRSIGNWNHQLEDLGLIFRTSNGRKSKATFVLPLTDFAVKMSTQKIEQVLTELKLYDTNESSKVFGRFQSVTKLYVKSQTADTITGILCVHLNRASTVGTTVLNSVDTYIFNVLPTPDENVVKRLSEYEGNGRVAIVNGEEKITLGKKAFESSNCFLVNVPFKVDETAVYEIMSQLTKDNVDFSDLDQISIQNLGGKND
ncbi:MAG TPA: hypothetical protein DD738_12475 [Ruminiclostridium sp.]|nr:hypothetical protein [Ruminiclostridium sp.]